MLRPGRDADPSSRMVDWLNMKPGTSGNVDTRKLNTEDLALVLGHAREGGYEMVRVVLEATAEVLPDDGWYWEHTICECQWCNR